MLASFLFSFEDFVLHMPCWLHFSLGSLSYTYRPGFFFFLIWGVSLAHPVLALFLPGEFIWRIQWILSPSLWSFSPVLPSFLSGEFLLHIPSWLHFYVESFPYTPHVGFLLWGGVLLHIPSWLLFYVGSFSYTSRAGFVSCEELLSSVVYSEDNSLRKGLGGSWPRRKVWNSHTQTREESPRTTWTEQNKTEQELSEMWAQEWEGKKRNGSEL